MTTMILQWIKKRMDLGHYDHMRKTNNRWTGKVTVTIQTLQEKSRHTENCIEIKIAAFAWAELNTLISQREWWRASGKAFVLQWANNGCCCWWVWWWWWLMGGANHRCVGTAASHTPLIVCEGKIPTAPSPPTALTPSTALPLIRRTF